MYDDDEVAHRRDVVEQVPDEGQARAPDERADRVVERVPAVRHVADAGGDRGEGAHDRHEARRDHGEAAEADEEGVGALDVLAAEEAALFALEDRAGRPCGRSGSRPRRRANAADRDRQADPPDRRCG